MPRVLWTRSVTVLGRVFLFSPRFNRTYVMDAGTAENTLYTAVLGLPARGASIQLADPAAAVARVGRFEKPVQPAADENAVDVGRLLPTLYLFIHKFRSVATIARCAACIRVVRRFAPATTSMTVADIGKTAHWIEIQAGVSDCYPRSIITAILCARAGRDCSIAVGILAPTKLLHAWCSSKGVIPYEPVRHHWWFQPLAVFDISS